MVTQKLKLFVKIRVDTFYQQSILIGCIASLITMPLLPLSVNSSAYAADSSCNKDFYSSNSIEFYDECAAICSTSSGLIMDSKDNTSAIFKYLTSTKFSTFNNQPMNAAQAAGFLGNFSVESGLDPTIIQSGKKYNKETAYDRGVGGYAFGIVQWDTTRRVDLLKYADDKKQDWRKLELQLAFIKYELEGKEKAAAASIKSVEATDYANAAKLVAHKYERPAEPDNPKRLKYAKKIYEEYKDLANTGVATDSTDSLCSTTGGGGNGDIIETAKSLSWEKRAEYGAKDHTAKQNKKEYSAALKETGVNKLGDSCSKGGNSCDAFIATVIRYSGVDPNFLCCGANNQYSYLKKHPEKFKEVSSNVKSTKELEPGDILWRSGHVKIYIGDGREAAASHCERTGEQATIALSDGTYHAFRVIK